MPTNEIRIGALATLMGPFASMGEDGMRGVELAIAEFGGEIGGKSLILCKEGSNAIPDHAVYMTEKLLHEHHADFVVGPLSGNEGLAVRDFAKTVPDKAFLNGTAGAQDITLRDPAPNFYNFITNGVQWMAGLGTYAYKKLNYRRIAIIAEDYSFPHAQVGGFMLEFCKAGGRVVQKFWVPLGTVNFSHVISTLPDPIDAILVALGGADAVNFLEQYANAGGTAPLIGGSITVDQPVLNVESMLAERVVGMVSSSPIADNNPDPIWVKFVQAYRDLFPEGLTSPSLTAYGYYLNTKAALLGLTHINADLSEGQARFMQVLNKLEFESPTGLVKLDHNRQAIANIFIRVVDKDEDGKLYNRLVKTIPRVNQTLGIPEEEYLKIGSLGRDNPNCG